MFDIKSIIKNVLKFFLKKSSFSKYSVNNSRVVSRCGKNSQGGTGMTEALEVLTQWTVCEGQDAGGELGRESSSGRDKKLRMKTVGREKDLAWGHPETDLAEFKIIPILQSPPKSLQNQRDPQSSSSSDLTLPPDARPETRQRDGQSRTSFSRLCSPAASVPRVHCEGPY